MQPKELLEVYERRMSAEDIIPSRVYDRVAGTVADPEYEAVRRRNTLQMMGRRDEALARAAVWC